MLSDLRLAGKIVWMAETSEENNVQRVLILTADAGSGHRSAAQAIEAALAERRAGRCRISVVNPLREAGSPGFLSTIFEDRYDDWVQRDPALYELSYRVSDSLATAAIIEQVSSMLLHDALRSLLERHQPDVVVCTSPLYLEPLQYVFDRSGQMLPTVSVITDLAGVHTLWFSPRVDLCLVPTEQARRKALRSGVAADRVHVTGLPVHPRFGAETRSPDQIRAELGWQAELATALIVGGTRVNKVLDISRLLDRSELPLQLVVVAGGDESLYAQLAGEKWRGPVHVYGFAHNMPALIRASDLVITKAGGLIVSETLACGRPLIFCSAIPGQETGNVEYVTSAGAGEWAPAPDKVLARLSRWLAHGGALLAERTANARLLGCPHAAFAVADLIWQLCEAGPRPASHELGLRRAALFPLKASIRVSRAIDRLEQDLRDVTDPELARLAAWCVNQIETLQELERIEHRIRQRRNKLASRKVTSLRNRRSNL